MFNKTQFNARLFSAAASSIILSTGLTGAYADTPARGEQVEFNIDAPMLADALRAFGAQSGAPILFTEALVAGRAAPRLNGNFAPTDALYQLLEGSGLEAIKGPGQAIVIRKRADADRPANPPARPVQTETPAESLPETAHTGADDATLRVDTVTITGTSLRGISPESSPLQIYSREDILGSGVTTTEQFIRTLPQNFGGGSTELAPAGLPGDSNSQFNNTFGSGANLRGLGSGGTLTLLNGTRLAPTSEIGDFVDLSMIPLSALERVDVLTDGASSIYGGDAVAGVMNFVLRDDFDGAETAMRYGAVTDGGLAEYRVSQTLGRAWDSGHVIGTYEYFDRSHLTLSERPEIPVPTQTNGVPIIDTAEFDLLPEQTRHSGLLSVAQEVGPDLRISASGLYSKRDAQSQSVFASSSSSVLGFDVTSELQSLSLGADYTISPRWAANANATYSQMYNTESAQTLAPVPSEPSEKVTRSKLWSADLRLNGDLWELPGGTVKSAIGAHVRRETFVNEQRGAGAERDGKRDVSAIYGEVLVPIIGPDTSLPGVRRLEVNLSGRLDDYSDFGTTVNPKIGLVWSPAEGFTGRATYSESFAPPPLGRTGDLNRTAAVVPYAFILGLLGGIAPPDPSLAGVDYLQTTGTAANLDPETSRTYTAGLDYVLNRGPHNWSLKTTYYDIAFEGRLGATPIPLSQPAPLAPHIAWANPDVLPDGTVIFFPSTEDLESLVATLSQPVIFLTGGNSLDNVAIINNAAIVRNLAATETRGLDVQIDYDVETDWGDISVGVNANYILDFTQQASKTTLPVETLNTYLNPVDLQLRGHIGLSRDGFTGNVFVNYVDSYNTDATLAARPISSWTTIDAAMSYGFGNDGARWLSGTHISVSATNLFDEMPPVTPSIGTSRIAGFDPANASPLGRFIAVELRKAF
ncbi:TonB-dependent receptor domain-containing protein [Hyphomonas sp.]|uniref:TonB-dependent receptor domain-containing protein n=1 Tax=Hyphomonas sp. TaxID=87 RepID=UPI003564EAA4